MEFQPHHLEVCICSSLPKPTELSMHNIKSFEESEPPNFLNDQDVVSRTHSPAHFGALGAPARHRSAHPTQLIPEKWIWCVWHKNSPRLHSCEWDVWLHSKASPDWKHCSRDNSRHQIHLKMILRQFATPTPSTPTPFRNFCNQKCPFVRLLENFKYAKQSGGVIHCASRNDTWKTRVIRVINGTGHYIEKFGEVILSVVT